MQGVNLKKTYATDFAIIYPLLLEFNAPYSREDWKKIFEYHWDGAPGYIGYHLEYHDQVVGFMGLIFSCRYYNGCKHKFCNITSLIVKPAYRMSTILFVHKLKELKDCILTGFSPIKESYNLLTMIGFTAFETNYKIVPVINGLLYRGPKINFYERNDIFEKVDLETRRILLDHVGTNCKNLLIALNSKSCLLIYKLIIQRYRGISVKKIRIIYINNVAIFNENLFAILKVFVKLFGLLSALYIDYRYIIDNKKLFFIARTISPPRICMGNPHNINVDELYSEAVLL